MKTIVSVVVFVMVMTGVAYAGTDYTCVSRCTAQGYQYGLCMSQCSWQ